MFSFVFHFSFHTVSGPHISEDFTSLNWTKTVDGPQTLADTWFSFLRLFMCAPTFAGADATKVYELADVFHCYSLDHLSVCCFSSRLFSGQPVVAFVSQRQLIPACAGLAMQGHLQRPDPRVSKNCSCDTDKNGKENELFFFTWKSLVSFTTRMS